MADSFAQTIASGTQDLAALVGLFCTDGVERNALFVQSGYFGIAISSLSLLGVLGLVRSAVKVALGLQRCSNAGFNLDSLRGLYGYLPEESEEQKNRIECYFTEVTFGPARDAENGTIAPPQFEHVIIRRKKRFFDPQLTPIVNVGSDWEENVHFRTVVNLGNLRREKSMSQSPVLIGLLLFLCPGITAWLLLVVSTTLNGVTLVATLGLHISLTLLLAVPIWHGRNMSQPGAYMSVNAWNLLTLGKHKSQPDVETKPNKLSFLHARIADADFIHISGDRKLLGSERMQGLVLLPAIVCAVAYVCQYAVLRKASNRQSLIWVGCQAALALLRLFFWILDPQFDNPEGMETECAIFDNTQFRPLTLMELTCACSESLTGTYIPGWAWDYLMTKNLRDLLNEALPDNPPVDGPPEDGLESLILWDIDFERLIRHHLHQFQPGQSEIGPWMLGLERVGGRAIRPFFLVKLTCSTHKTRQSTNENREWLEHNWVKASSNPTSLLKGSHQIGWNSIIKPCTLHVFNQQGKRIHLLPKDGICTHKDQKPVAYDAHEDENLVAYEVDESWYDFKNGSQKVCELLDVGFSLYKREFDTLVVEDNFICIVATPGIVDRRGERRPARTKTTRTWEKNLEGGTHYSLEFVSTYIEHGLQSGHEERSGNGMNGVIKHVLEYIKKSVRIRSRSNQENTEEV
ncbi:hypothetical protein P3342_000288 [Pyrenophora teres f. teres]|nr:hypothetical protein P3342_000288 [Pyrenophora teres f. teres]